MLVPVGPCMRAEGQHPERTQRRGHKNDPPTGNFAVRRRVSVARRRSGGRLGFHSSPDGTRAGAQRGEPHGTLLEGQDRRPCRVQAECPVQEQESQRPGVCHIMLPNNFAIHRSQSECAGTSACAGGRTRAQADTHGGHVCTRQTSSADSDRKPGQTCGPPQQLDEHSHRQQNHQHVLQCLHMRT